MNIQTDIWIGLVGLYPSKLNTIITQNQGAYANVLLIAFDCEDYISKTKEFMSKMNFDIFEIEDVDRLYNRMKNFEVDSSIIDLANEVQIKKIPQISTLHIFDRVDF